MGKKYHDRYEDFRKDDMVKTLPFFKINERPTDVYVKYKINSRLDIISYDVYGTPYYGWLILQANPTYGGLEGNIPVGASIRVPFPLVSVLQELENKHRRFDDFYGI
jgi:hypothetical protein